MKGISYSAQYDTLLKGRRESSVERRKPTPKPSLDAQSVEVGAKKLPFSKVWTTKKLGTFNWGSWSLNDALVRATILGLHLLTFAAPFTFSWSNLRLAAVLYFLTGCLGIVIGYHRLLSHRSFACPKLLEYTLAYLAVLGLEQHPIWWARHHRYHHRHSDTALDPHSPYEGLPWAFCGWIMNTKVLRARAGDSAIVPDLRNDRFYRFIGKTYILHSVALYSALYWAGGFGAIVWGGAVRQVAMWWVTWVVNSACHVWGERPYATGDLSTNLWWLAILTWGDSWHNNHHALPFSARHGMEWYEIDIAYGIIKLFELVGLAWDVQTPTEEQKRSMAASNKPSAPVDVHVSATVAPASVGWAKGD